MYTEKYRPQFHYSPKRNFMNDPNGLFYLDGKYHLFYQYNPYGNEWGHMSWGHAVSKDLIHWEELSIALHEEKGSMIFSGSAVYDKYNTSGFGNETEGCCVAIYTSHDEKTDRQRQNLAYSINNGYKWIKYKNNPVIDLNMDNFRDPKVFWYSPQNKWIMVLVLASKKIVRFYTSKNLIDWTYLSDFGAAGLKDTEFWECPDLFELPVENESGVSHWILKVDVINNALNGGSGSQYFVGRFNGTSFCNDNPDELILCSDFGSDFYAAQSFNNLPVEQKRCIWIAWMNNWLYADNIPTKPWRGNMTIPREISLKKIDEGIRLCQSPVKEIKLLRHEIINLKNEKFTAGIDVLKKYDFYWGSFEIIAEFRLKQNSNFGFSFKNIENHLTLVGFKATECQFFIDRTKSGTSDFNKNFEGIHYAPLTSKNTNLIKIHLLVDMNSVEMFCDEGEAVITDLIFPNQTDCSIALFADKKESVEIISLQIFKLNGIF